MFRRVSNISNILQEFPKNVQCFLRVSNISNILQAFPKNFQFFAGFPRFPIFQKNFQSVYSQPSPISQAASQPANQPSQPTQPSSQPALFCRLLESRTEHHQIEPLGIGLVDFCNQEQKVFKLSLLGLVLSTSGDTARKSRNRAPLGFVLPTSGAMARTSYISIMLTISIITLLAKL